MSDVLLPRLIAELPELGGWPEWAHECVLHTGSKKAMFYDEDGRFSHQPKFPQIEFDKESDIAVSVSREAYEAELAASKTEWDGEGLPPVGLPVELQFWNDGKTEIVRVIAYHGNEAWVEFTEDCRNTLIGNPEFRPIRSEADKKKEKVVDEIMSWMHYAGRAEVGLIYDAIKSGKIIID